MKDKLKFTKRSVSVGLVVCFVAVIAWTGFYVFSRYDRQEENQLAKEQAQEQTAEKEEETPATQEANSQTIENPSDFVLEEPSQVQVYTPSFSSTDTLAWPIDGNVLMNYNMDQTVYFATLDQYKYNPALIIEGTDGMEVYSAASGTVTSVRKEAQTGKTVTVDLGNGYEAIYGQLGDVSIWEGVYVEKGGFIGYLSEPSKYYSVEGCNLYFQLLKDGEPVNPLDYLED